jgi:hypothetical protein
MTGNVSTSSGSSSDLEADGVAGGGFDLEHRHVVRFPRVAAVVVTARGED